MNSLLKSSSSLSKPQFKLDEAANFNMKLLRDNNFNLDNCLNNKKGVTSYGSEFNDKYELETLLGNHPMWKELKEKI